jgi:hypothetical protein
MAISVTGSAVPCHKDEAPHCCGASRASMCFAGLIPRARPTVTHLRQLRNGG